jgi:hypothetical protein
MGGCTCAVMCVWCTSTCVCLQWPCRVACRLARLILPCGWGSCTTGALHGWGCACARPLVLLRWWWWWSWPVVAMCSSLRRSMRLLPPDSGGSMCLCFGVAVGGLAAGWQGSSWGTTGGLCGTQPPMCSVAHVGCWQPVDVSHTPQRPGWRGACPSHLGVCTCPVAGAFLGSFASSCLLLRLTTFVPHVLSSHRTVAEIGKACVSVGVCLALPRRSGAQADGLVVHGALCAHRAAVVSQRLARQHTRGAAAATAW